MSLWELVAKARRAVNDRISGATIKIPFIDFAVSQTPFTLNAELTEVRFGYFQRQLNDWIFVELRLLFRITNTSSHAVHKWDLVIDGVGPKLPGRERDYRLVPAEFAMPAVNHGVKSRAGETILPSLSVVEERQIGVVLRKQTPEWKFEHFVADFEQMLPADLVITYRAITETSAGKSVETKFGDVADRAEILRRIGERC